MICFNRFLVLSVSMFALTACGGSGGPVQDVVSLPLEDPTDGEAALEAGSDNGDLTRESVGTEEPEDVPSEPSNLPETIVLETENLDLLGLAAVTDPETGLRVLVRRDGSFDVDAETLTFAGGDIALIADVSGGFDVASGFIQEAGQGVGNAVGVIGIATSAMPTDGTATFNGGAVVQVIEAGGATELTNGTSIVDVNFAAGTVSVDLLDFGQAVHAESGTVNNDPPIEGLALIGATISGSGFSGGTLESIGGDTVAAIVGDNASFAAEGQFYGDDPDSNNPAEVGGLIVTEGDSGKIFGSFIAN